MVARAMWVRLDPPKGRPITTYDASELFELIDKLRRSLGAPRFHHVLITDEFNAAVVQTPQLGLLGWYRNTLLIGLPLMKALTRQQLAAVLAHEFGHLAGGHGRLGNWIYRLRFGWVRLAQALQERRSLGSFAFRPFFKWYAPYFSSARARR
jgi:Zn-dependent protease with chaperone function